MLFRSHASSSQYACMPFIPNPYYAAYNMNGMNAYQMPYFAPNACDEFMRPLVQKKTPKVKVDLNPPKPEVVKKSKLKAGTNNQGPKTAWVPKST